jgi:GT2 family glycosyltransferase
LAGRVGIPAGENPEQPIAHLEHPDAVWIDHETPDELGHTANLAVRRAALEQVGGFDELLGGGARFRAGEDKDLLDRLFIAGLRGRYEPAAGAVHLPWRSRSDLIAVYWAYGIGTGARLAKLLRTDRPRFPRVLTNTFWEWGLREIWRAVRRRYKFFILGSSVRTVAMCTGFVCALPCPIRDGHFLGPESPRPERVL